jgi:glycosyltransferase involved in cell wall biosynthesis
MKICLINNLYPPHSRGGAEVAVQNIAAGLKATGHEVFVITTHPWEDWKSLKPRVGERGGVRIYEFFPANIYHYSNGHNHNKLARYFWHFFDILNLHSFFVVKNILEDEKPDIVWTHNLMGVGMLVVEAIKRLGIRHWHTIHDVQLSLPSGLIVWGEEDNAEAKSPLRPFYERAMRDILGNLEIIFSPSKWLLNFYRSRGFFQQSKQLVLQNPVNLGVSGTLRVCRVPETGKSVVRFLYLGQIEEYKGVRMLTKVFRHLLNEGFDLELVIAGEGSILEEIKVLAFDEARIKILGAVPHERIGELFAGADYLVVPSQCLENSPTVIFESFSCGVPVLASNAGGIPEIVRNGINGYLFYPTEEGLRGGILRAAVHLDEREKLCKDGYDMVASLNFEEYLAKLKVLF